jgi:hypothetical protein
MVQTTNYLIASSVLLAMCGAAFIYRRLAGRSFLDRLMYASIPLLLTACAVRILLGIAARPYSEWDTVRLTPVFAFWQGSALYPTPDTGPLISYCYGPVSALAYLPVVMSPTPTIAVLAAAALTVFLLLAPVLWILYDCQPSPKQWLDAVVAFLAFCGIAFILPSLSYSLFSPAHDAVALGLGGIATAVVCRGRPNLGTVPLVISAITAVLSVWSKQTMVPLLVALPLFVLVTCGVRAVQRYVGLIAVFGIVSALLFAAVFGYDGLILNLFEIPLDHVRDKKLTDAIRYFQSELPVVVIVLVFAMLYVGSRYQANSNEPVRPRTSGYWLAFVTVGLMLVPSGLAAYIKLGGGENSFSFPLYFLAIGATVLLTELKKPSAVPEQKLIDCRVAQGMLLACGCLLLGGPVLSLKILEKANYADPLEAAFAFEKKYPGKAYFPWNTLSVVMASGNVYHAEDGILSLAMAGRDLNVDQFHRHLPTHATLLALPPNYPAYWTNRRIQRVLPEFQKPVTVDELPGWMVYERVGNRE